jgi:lipoyl(octanoyl) transferase
MKYNIIDLGLIDYNKAYLFQRDTLSRVKSGNIKGALIFAQHYPVFTIGRSGKDNNLLLTPEKINSRGIDIINIDRGGDITFHGPGQVIAYPIFDLNNHKKDLHDYLRNLESVIIQSLARYKIACFRVPDKTGCWTSQGKIASIGVSASSWITYHGLALNANVDLSYFDMINPCGLNGVKMVSINKLLQKDIDLKQLKSRLAESFSDVFNVEFTPAKS